MTSHPDTLDIKIPGLESHLIGGQWCKGTGRMADVISPTTEEAIVQVAVPSQAEADAAVAAARKAFDSGPLAAAFRRRARASLYSFS